jgi:hypothetical protein
LKNKSENYEDQTLKWIFLLNNTYKLAKLFNETNKNQTEIKLTIYGLFILAGKSELKTFYDKEIINYKREYSAWLDLFKKLNLTSDIREQYWYIPNSSDSYNMCV